MAQTLNNPLNWINSVDPKDRFNPINSVDPGNPGNPINRVNLVNRYNPDKAVKPVHSQHEGGVKGFVENKGRFVAGVGELDRASAF